jgi:hypothetical protein
MELDERVEKGKPCLLVAAFFSLLRRQEQGTKKDTRM